MARGGLRRCCRPARGFRDWRATQLMVRSSKAALLVRYGVSVDPDSRRKGIGRWLLETINDAVFVGRGADLIFSTFEGGKAGSLTVQAAFDERGLAVHRFHQSPVLILWANAAAALDQAGKPNSTRRIYVDESFQLLFANPDSGEDEVLLPTLKRLDALIRAEPSVSFELTDSFLAYLRNPPSDAGGGYWFTFDDGHWCFVICSVTRVAYNENAIETSVLIQSVLHESCTSDQIIRCLLELAERAFCAGRRTLVAYTHSQVPLSVFRRLGFESNGQFDLFIRDIKALVETLDVVAHRIS